MTPLITHLAFTLACIFALMFASVQSVRASLSAEEIVRHIQDKAQSVAESENGPTYEYQKRTKLEKMDRAFKETLETKVTISKVTQKRGVLRSHVISIDGDPITDPKTGEGKAQNRKNEAPMVVTGGPNKSPWLNHKIISRFVFELTGEETVAGRKCWVLKFTPKTANLPTGELADRFINRLGGTVVVDQVEFEVARMEVRLLEKVAILGGLLGNLEHLSLILARRRLDDGNWIDNSSSTRLSGRKLMSSINFRASEESFDIKKVSSSPVSHPKI